MFCFLLAGHRQTRKRAGGSGGAGYNNVMEKGTKKKKKIDTSEVESDPHSGKLSPAGAAIHTQTHGVHSGPLAVELLTEE